MFVAISQISTNVQHTTVVVAIMLSALTPWAALPVPAVKDTLVMEDTVQVSHTIMPTIFVSIHIAIPISFPVNVLTPSQSPLALHEYHYDNELCIVQGAYVLDNFRQWFAILQISTNV